MSDNKNIDNPDETEQSEVDSNLAVSRCDVASITSKSSINNSKLTAERQIKFERAQKCLENAALVSKRIKEHRKATAELLGRPYEDDNADNQSELASTMSEKTGYSVATDASTTLSVQDALNIPGISESLANTLKQKEILMQRIKQYKEISKRPSKTTPVFKKELTHESSELRKSSDKENSKLMNLVKDKEKALSLLQVKLKATETTILDMQEKLHEKDQIIEAKNKATTIISDSLTKKEKDAMDILDDTKEQMIKMQNNFVAMEGEWKEEKMKLLADIEAKDDQLKSLKEANTILENSRFEISLANSRLSEELESKAREVRELRDKLREMTGVYVEDEPARQSQEEKGSKEMADMTELTRKIEVLERLNSEIRQTNKELEIQLASTSKEAKSPTVSPSKRASPLPTRKGRNTASKMKSPWSKLSAEALNQDPEKKPTKSETIVRALNKDLLEKDYIISQKDTIIRELTSSNDRKENVIDELKSQLQLLSQKQPLFEKVDVGTETEKSDLPAEPKDTTSVDGNSEERLKAAREQIALLTEEIDAANKNMIKVKSNCKLKLKQMQKTIDKFGSVSDANAEIVRLNEEIHQLSQKVAELEEEKGNLQLHLVDYDSGRLTDTDIYKKMVEMENLAEARLKSISLLETQKFDLVQELHVLQQKNAEMEDKIADISQLENEQVCSEIKSVQLEEQIDGLVAAKKELELVVENLKLDKEHVERNIDSLKTEKEELLQKLEHYVQENIDLTDKLEKLSAEKVSSAESIEIVESLTTQEKLEIEEYNKGIQAEKADESTEPPVCSDNTSISKLMLENEELKCKIELFSQEREEVMDKMNTICTENNTIHKNIEDLENRCRNLQTNIDQLCFEKAELINLNKELKSQIEELKHQRLDIVKEAAEVKPIAAEDTVDNPLEFHQDDKAVGDKASKGAKSVKQLTKEILKLKNIIKEREDDIADCQMKILSLEESQEKQSELTQSTAAYEVKIKQLSEENKYLKIQNDSMMNEKLEQTHLKDTIEPLQHEIQRLQREYSAAVNSRDAKVQELEHLLGEYEKQIINYSNTLQQKDKDINEYVNQVTKLNDVTQKLKSRIELFEEEKANDQNVELIQSLNQQILLYQNALAECEEKLRTLEEEKAQLASIKSKLESKHVMLDSELSKLKETHNENQKLIEELKRQQQKHREDWAEVMLQAKDRDEEIHEIKLQLRKESIENEKLRTMLQQKEHGFSELMTEREELKKRLEVISHEETSKSDLTALENKNKELIEKLKKFALSIKKKTAMYSDLENQFNDMQKQLEIKSEQYEQAMIQVETVPALQDKLKYANEELNRISTEKNILEDNLLGARSELESLQKKYEDAQEEIIKLNDSLNSLNMELKLNRDENVTLNLNMESLTNKLVEYEIELKNSSNLLTKINCLESEIDQKQTQIENLSSELHSKDQNISQLQFGLDAKVQERDMYIENLQFEIDKYKNRIYRLEESISVMENRRQSLERKADQLDTQLQEKQKSYTDYSVQEDELVTRLATLMDHDRVLEKELHEIENDNKNLHYKIHDLNEDLSKLQKDNSELQLQCTRWQKRSGRCDFLETVNRDLEQKIEELETNFKKLHNEHQQMLAQRKMEMDDVEAEFNTQIEAAIKEKKHLSVSVEKLNEHIQRLESEINDYRITIENLHINLEELSTQNRKLEEQSSNENPESPDYTEQYISEINRLNAIINSKNSQITEEMDKIQTLQDHNNSLKCTAENNVAQLSAKLEESFQQLQDLSQENESLKSDIRELNILITQKEDQIKQLIEKKKLVFEMNIPKTEGMTISSTIEELNDEQKSLSVLQTQILSDAEITNQEINTFKKVDATNSEKPISYQQSEGSVEPLIVSKKAYMCSNPDNSKDVDPFNSDEGWGLGESEEIIYDVTPGVTQLNLEIKQLKDNNESLKKELEASTNKLLRAIKKLKELKNANDMLANELKISKQISNSSMLDMAIESELSSNLEMLEKKVQDLTDTLNKEKKDKETLTKQNDILKNANDRLIELKEKMDNELELWKYNFKQANDKISINQQQPSEVQHEKVQTSKIESKLEEDILKLEKENDELQGLVDAIKSENEKLSGEITTLNQEVITLRQKCMDKDDCDLLKKQIEDLINTNNDLSVTSQKLHGDISASEDRYQQLVNINKDLKASCKENENDKLDLIQKCAFIETESVALKSQNEEALSEIKSLRETLEAIQLELLQERQNLEQVRNNNTLSDRNEIIEKECETLKAQLEDVNRRNESIELEKSTITESYQGQLCELKSKIDKLNLENDQLLSTVTELRSSVSSAMDQRGFEIAELWKQHLAQRESEFQSNEQDLRMQLNASESKYEQLLESVQSSTQEETNKILILEQVTSLQNKLQEKEMQLNNLQIKYEDVMHQLDILRSEMEDEKMIHENKILVQQEEYEKIIADMRSEIEKYDEGNDTVNSLQIELVATKSVNDSLNQRIEELKYSYESRISELSKAVQLKESEIFQKTHDYTITLADRNNEFEIVRKQLLEYERKVEDLTYEKESELAVLRLKMHENTEHYQKLRTESEKEKVKLSETLNEKIIECTNLNRQIFDLNKILEEYANKAAETQLVLESQELEIVTLKDEIESMKTTLRAASTRIEKHVTFASDTKNSGDGETAMNNELLDAVPRAELDLALYMLHQRDVRCEELTIELTQLLEERDTLQLRLSDSLRSYEELKSHHGSIGLDNSIDLSHDTISELPNFSIEKESQFADVHRAQTSRSSSICETDGDKPKLQAKLSELRSVKHSRDVRLRHESEQRQLGLRLLQQDVANLPPQAREQLNQAHHTLSRDSQSTPTVLLNWLRGKSTPKVVHM
ncbi:protein lava lamp-like isoform X1 [Pieris brassicae]|uniref:protein lava lamp-like isoform X1 n=2 Tax=Pieris brassicae TaxID=7116 RepID=UPI001E6612EB|nr:protein lava lamp-like isoform X1 [Pieris brassicae]